MNMYGNQGLGRDPGVEREITTPTTSYEVGKLIILINFSNLFLLLHKLH